MRRAPDGNLDTLIGEAAVLTINCKTWDMVMSLVTSNWFPGGICNKTYFRSLSEVDKSLPCSLPNGLDMLLCT